jgi:hypothetical protein
MDKAHAKNKGRPLLVCQQGRSLASAPRSLVDPAISDVHPIRSPEKDFCDFNHPPVFINLNENNNQVADIGHCCAPLEAHKIWVKRLEDEMFGQVGILLRPPLASGMDILCSLYAETND